MWALSPKAATVLFIAAAVCVSMRTASAQTQSAQLNGIISDASGAIIPGAKVLVTNIDTGVSRSGASNETGNFVFTGLAPGRYRVEVTREGFRSAVIESLSLDVNQASSIRIMLNVGQVIEKVEVQAEAASLEATTAQLGTVVTENQILDLPLNARNFTQLLTLSPGASPISVAQNNGGGAAQKVGIIVMPAVNGQSNRSNSFTLDGIYNNGHFQGTYAVAPSVDALSQFKVQSHGDQAEFGSVTGGVINILSRSGTNEFHGTAYEFLRNDALDARGFFAARKPPLRQNQFGATVGGPIRRDRTFFFFSYEGYRQVNASAALYVVPTQQELAGDFSRNARRIFNPYTTRPDPQNPARQIRDPFPDNRIPSNLLNRSSLAWAEAVYPKPVETGVAGFNGRSNTPQTFPADQYSIRVDHTFSQRDFLWGRYTWGEQNVKQHLYFDGATLSTNTPAANGGAGYTHIFGPDTVVTGLFGYSTLTSTDVRFLSSRNLIEEGYFKGVPQNPNQNVPGMNVPSIVNADVRNRMLGPMKGYQGRVDLSTVKGRHTLKFGFEVVAQPWHNSQPWALFTFNSIQTADLQTPGTTGIDLASFVLGAMDSWNVVDQDYRIKSRIWSTYVQDSWKIANRLTFNYGLRWDLLETPWLIGNTMGTWDFNAGRYLVGSTPPPQCSATQGAPCLVDPNSEYIRNYVRFTGSPKLRGNDYKMFGPRVGLAYRLFPKTVFRSSFGMFFDLMAGVNQQAQNTVNNWPAVGNVQQLNLNRTTVQYTVDDPFQGRNVRIPAANPGALSAFYVDPFFQNPYSNQWNAEVQQELPDNSILSVAYVGSHNLRMPTSGVYNTAQTPGPGAIAPRQLYPYAPVTNYDRSVGQSSYHALQVKTERRLASGFSYLVSYTWSKSIDWGSSGQFNENLSIQDPYVPSGSKSVSGFDIPHMFSVAALYDLPFGRGRRWLNSGPASKVFGNWQVNAIVQLRSGQPFTPTMNTDIANIGSPTARPNLVGDPGLTNPAPSLWFNKAAFAAPPAFTFGSAGRNILRTDSLSNLDFSLFREDQLHERVRSQFRVEVFNIFNHPSFGTPGSNFTDQARFGVISGTVSRARQIQLALKLVF
jgi:hypothetical protein